MAARHSKKQASFMQYSKRLSTAVMIFWGIFRLVSLLVLALKPEASTAIVAFSEGIDGLAMCNVIAYTANSTSEKAMLGYFEMKKKTSAALFTQLGTNAEEEDEDEEYASNG